jgi:protein-tyrosine phosphatase
VSSSPLRVTTVCSGNICRSPTAEVVLRDALERAGLGHAVRVDSAGIGGWHVGDPADGRALRTMHAHGYDGSAHRVRQITASWFDRDDAPDLLLAMDSTHHRDLVRLAPDADVRMVRSFDPQLADLVVGDPALDVPDPYYGSTADYEAVLAMLERATPGLVEHLRTRV